MNPMQPTHGKFKTRTKPYFSLGYTKPANRNDTRKKGTEELEYWVKHHLKGKDFDRQRYSISETKNHLGITETIFSCNGPYVPTWLSHSETNQLAKQRLDLLELEFADNRGKTTKENSKFRAYQLHINLVHMADQLTYCENEDQLLSNSRHLGTILARQSLHVRAVSANKIKLNAQNGVLLSLMEGFFEGLSDETIDVRSNNDWSLGVSAAMLNIASLGNYMKGTKFESVINKASVNVSDVVSSMSGDIKVKGKIGTCMLATLKWFAYFSKLLNLRLPFEEVSQMYNTNDSTVLRVQSHNPTKMRTDLENDLLASLEPPPLPSKKMEPARTKKGKGRKTQHRARPGALDMPGSTSCWEDKKTETLSPNTHDDVSDPSIIQYQLSETPVNPSLGNPLNPLTELRQNLERSNFTQPRGSDTHPIKPNHSGSFGFCGNPTATAKEAIDEYVQKVPHDPVDEILVRWNMGNEPESGSRDSVMTKHLKERVEQLQLLFDSEITSQLMTLGFNRLLRRPFLEEFWTTLYKMALDFRYQARNFGALDIVESSTLYSVNPVLSVNGENFLGPNILHAHLAYFLLELPRICPAMWESTFKIIVSSKENLALYDYPLLLLNLLECITNEPIGKLEDWETSIMEPHNIVEVICGKLHLDNISGQCPMNWFGGLSLQGNLLRKGLKFQYKSLGPPLTVRSFFMQPDLVKKRQSKGKKSAAEVGAEYLAKNGLNKLSSIDITRAQEERSYHLANTKQHSDLLAKAEINALRDNDKIRNIIKFTLDQLTTGEVRMKQPTTSHLKNTHGEDHRNQHGRPDIKNPLQSKSWPAGNQDKEPQHESVGLTSISDMFTTGGLWAPSQSELGSSSETCEISGTLDIPFAIPDLKNPSMASDTVNTPNLNRSLASSDKKAVHSTELYDAGSIMRRHQRMNPDTPHGRLYDKLDPKRKEVQKQSRGSYHSSVGKSGSARIPRVLTSHNTTDIQWLTNTNLGFSYITSPITTATAFLTTTACFFKVRLGNNPTWPITLEEAYATLFTLRLLMTGMITQTKNPRSFLSSDPMKNMFISKKTKLDANPKSGPANYEHLPDNQYSIIASPETLQLFNLYQHQLITAVPTAFNTETNKFNIVPYWALKDDSEVSFLVNEILQRHKGKMRQAKITAWSPIGQDYDEALVAYEPPNSRGEDIWARSGEIRSTMIQDRFQSYPGLTAGRFSSPKAATSSDASHSQDPNSHAAPVPLTDAEQDELLMEEIRNYNASSTSQLLTE